MECKNIDFINVENRIMVSEYGAAWGRGRL
jgi:hypothetical protein